MSDQERNSEETAAETPQAAAGKSPEGAGQPGDEAGEMSPEELRQKLEEHFREQKVADVLIQFLISLSTLAYVKMGITEDTEKHKDLEQAGLAIDSFKAILESAGKGLPEQDAKALAGALASMQVTFVRASEAEGSQEGAGEKEKNDPASRLWVPGREQG